MKPNPICNERKIEYIYHDMTAKGTITSFPSLVLSLITASVILVSGCESDIIGPVPYQGRWGIYMLDLTTQHVSLIYSSSNEIFTSALRLNSLGKTFLFAQKIEGDSRENYEICTIGVNGSNFQRLTNNAFWDIYPAWSSDDTHIAFLSLRQTDLDIYLMRADGSHLQKLYDSGSHDADIDWVGDEIVFTSNSRIWSIKSDGTFPFQLTNPPKAAEWGNTNLPFGDYDPRLSPDGTKVVFERLEDDASPHGNYNIYIINADGSGETRLTNTGYSQGLASWSHSGDKIVYTVSAVDTQGKYDLYMMNADGTNNHNITPDYFPDAFLCHAAIFSKDDSKIFFIGEWFS